MNELNEKRKAQNEIEKSNVSIFIKALESEKKRFEYAETSQWLLDDKCDTDLIYIQEKLSEWSAKAKDTQKPVLNEMYVGIMRVYSYIENMRTLCKTAVSKYVGLEKENARLNSELNLQRMNHSLEIKKLTKELENAKKEIEFIQGNNS